VAIENVVWEIHGARDGRREEARWSNRRGGTDDGNRSTGRKVGQRGGRNAVKVMGMKYILGDILV
jgi:hypothetical protein